MNIVDIMEKARNDNRDAIKQLQQMVIDASLFKSGTYVDEDGGEWVVSYKVEGNDVFQLIDGRVTDNSRVEFSGVKGQQFTAYDRYGGYSYTNSAKEAALLAWGKPSDEGWERK